MWCPEYRIWRDVGNLEYVLKMYKELFHSGVANQQTRDGKLLFEKRNDIFFKQCPLL